jgi:hypothetical protein
MSRTSGTAFSVMPFANSGVERRIRFRPGRDGDDWKCRHVQQGGP